MSLHLKLLFFLSSLFVIAIINSIFLFSLERNGENKLKWEHHTHEVILQTEKFLSFMKDIETGQRGFLLTKNITYLEPYNIGLVNTKVYFKKLQELTSDNPEQQKRLKLIKKSMELKFTELAETIKLTRENNNNKALEIVKQNLGKQYMDDMRDLLNEFINAETILLKERESEYTKNSTMIVNILNIEVILFVLLALLTVSFLNKNLFTPLKLLLSYTQKMEKGEKINIADRDIRSNDEIGCLQSSFFKMHDTVRNRTKELQNHKDELELKVKQRTEEIHNQKELLEEAQRISHLGGWEWDITTNEAKWSNEVFRIFGEEPQSFIPTYDRFLSYLSEKVQTFLKKALTDAINNKERYFLVHEIHRKDGTIRYIQGSGNAKYNDQGEAISMIGTMLDITERYHLEEELKLSASVFTHAYEGIIITDSDHNIIDVNKAFVNITGFSPSEVLGKNPNILQSGRQDENFYKQLWNNLKENGFWEGELWNRKKSGEEYAEHLTISAVYDDNKVVQNYVAIFTDITLYKQQQEELEHMAHYDMLTNLPNRVLFTDRMYQAMAQASRREKLISVVYIDLDGFKEVNDTYGHEVGDKLLIILSERMNKLLRKSDTLSRIGGDEFVALLIDVSDKTSVISFFTRLLEVTSEPVPIDDLLLKVSASIGVTFYPQNEELDMDQIIKQADQAMYQAKMSGKSRYFIFNPEDNP
ncbi:MAG: diguanylate cyclase [Sulfurimonadaceae bacterium]